MTMVNTATFRIWRGGADGGKLEDYTTPISEGMVVLDAVHQIQATQANDLAVRWNCKAGKCGSCSAEVNGRQRPRHRQGPEPSVALCVHQAHSGDEVRAQRVLGHAPGHRNHDVAGTQRPLLTTNTKNTMAPASPAITPMAVSRSPSPINNRSTSPRAAPSAMRTPISWVL